MYEVRRLRAMGAMCREQAVYNPAKSIGLIAEAEFWEHLAEHELALKNAMRSVQVTTRRQASPQTPMTRHGRRLSQASGLVQEA